MTLNRLSEASYRIGRLILLALTTVLLLFVLLSLLRLGLIYWLYSSVEDWVTVRLGLDYYGAQLATTIVVSIFTALLPTLAWYVLLGRKRVWGTAAMIGGQALICLLVYTVGGQVCFDRRTGAPLCYYADTPAGRVWSYTPGYDPKTGRPFKLYTREEQEKDESQRREREEEGRRRQVEEQRLRDAVLRQQQQAEQRRLEPSAGQRPEREQRRLEQIAQRQQQLTELQQAAEAQKQLEREQRSREKDERKREDSERQRREEEFRRLQLLEQQRRQETARIEEERELRRQAEQVRREREAEQRRRDAEERRQREEEQRRKDARSRLVIDLINKGIERIPRRRY